MQRIFHFFLFFLGVVAFSFCTPILAGSPDTLKKSYSADSRGHMPKAFINSYIGLSGGWPDFPFTNDDLENGFTASKIESPNFAMRLIIGHFFNPYIAVQASLMRPVKWVHYTLTAGGRHSVWISLFGLSLRPTWPITNKISLYGEGGIGLISRHGFDIGGVTAISNASAATLITGGGMTYAINRHWHLDFGLLYALQNKSKKQPDIFYASAGFYYLLFPSCHAVQTHTKQYIFPLNFIQAGILTNSLSDTDINRYFAPPYLPIFWTGDAKVRDGGYLMYERNFFHTDRTFSLDWGASISGYNSKDNNQSFFAFSIFPALRIWIIRSQHVDFYFTYSIAGPTILTRQIIDGIDTGSHFTFQDFLGVGFFLGKHKNFNINVKIAHYSNGNTFPVNPGIEIPLTVAIGYAF